MSQLLASDVNNTEFVGATNPDSALIVQFYKSSLKNDFQSEKEGRPIFFDVDMVRIMVPGDAHSIVTQVVREDHKTRFPIQWARYQNNKDDSTLSGTPLKDWSRLSPAQVEELKALKIFTVENVAGMTDANLQNIGMIAGMSPYALRDHAKRFLALAQSDAAALASEERVKAAEAETQKVREDMEQKMAAMAAQIAELAQNQKAKPGRKKKVAA